jgi:alpha-D-ribose 1-methylphosphonate 5-phosphate C-P lyase
MRYFGKNFNSSKDFINHWTKTEALCKYNGSTLTDAIKTDFDKRTFFCGDVEFDDEKFIMSVCY